MEEFLQAVAPLQVVKQRADRHACAHKDGCAAKDFGVAVGDAGESDHVQQYRPVAFDAQPRVGQEGSLVILSRSLESMPAMGCRPTSDVTGHLPL